MEESKAPTTKPRRRTSKRKPFIDLSNTIPSSLPSSQSSSSSLLKPPTKSSLSLPLKKSLLNNNPDTNLNSSPKLTAIHSTTNKNNHNEKKEDKEKGPANEANRSSTLSPTPRTPSVSGIGDCVNFEPYTVYNMRHTAKKREIKGKHIAEPSSCFSEMRMLDLRKRKYGDGDVGLSKSCPMPHKKKQRQEKAEVNSSKQDLPQDFIDKQRAYFAEIDAFELEEEVASADELE